MCGLPRLFQQGLTRSFSPRKWPALPSRDRDHWLWLQHLLRGFLTLLEWLLFMFLV